SNFLVIYLGLELLTLSSYALVALRRDNATASEAAMKYFVLGALASGFLLYGLSMMYGATGSLDIGFQTRCCTVSHVGSRRLPRRTNICDLDDWWRTKIGSFRYHHSFVG
ncbi:MAG: hypothetical protein RI918_1027, partial [Pseudomonadota bacterium]